VTAHFISDLVLSVTSWQGFERLVFRLLLHSGYEHLQLVGGSGDQGADVIASKGGRRWLFQVKRWAGNVGPSVVAKTVDACSVYSAEVPVVVSRTGFAPATYGQQRKLAQEGIRVQLWDRVKLLREAARLPDRSLADENPERWELRDYQAQAVERVMAKWLDSPSSGALIVLATGLGKTRVAAEIFRRIDGNRPGARVLVLAHRNELVYQLERAFWPFLRPSQGTAVWNGLEHPDTDTQRSVSALFASVDSVYSADRSGVELQAFDLVIVDECHHLGTAMYETVLDSLGVGKPGGPFLLGLTATPWRPGGAGLDHRFPEGPTISIDLVEGLRQGFLASVDYRMYTDNVDWDALRELHGDRFSPRGINRTLFIEEWDDAVVDRLREAWNEIDAPKAIVFCGTVAHAERMAARINAMGFTRAAAIYSRSSAGQPMGIVERSRTMWDFSEGRIGVLCAVDVLNEGVDVPDVNLVVFQRVTHSRRIFVQQFGRGLRLSPGKDRVIVLDFVSDVRRFAAGVEIEYGLGPGARADDRTEVRLGSRIRFFRANEEDVPGANFIREWLSDMQEVQDAGDDASVLRFPPIDLLPGGRR
jgi:superfamily II DNA or RNA helicase